MSVFSAFEIFAPAKLNLYLHITGKRTDGYHLLDSLIGFADIGDVLCFEPSERFTLSIQGPFAECFGPDEKSAAPDSKNLIARAVWGLARHQKKDPKIHIRLIKNLPLGAGIGGGSSDAAAAIWGLCQIWGLNWRALDISPLLVSLGADVPVCMNAHSARVQGIGEIITPLDMPENPMVLIYPGKPSHTPGVFARYEPNFRAPLEIMPPLGSTEALIDFLSPLSNDLYPPALRTLPVIDNVLNALNAAQGCRLARLSGSGSSSFGLFESEDQAKTAAQTIAQNNPDWWVRAGYIGKIARY